MTHSWVSSKYFARNSYILRRADDSISKRKIRKGDYGKPRLGLGGSSRSKELTKERRAEL
jgi:hypothetical protein